MFKAFVVLVVLNSPVPMQLEDMKGLYDTPFECYVRASTMIKDATKKVPIISATALCLSVGKDTPKEKSKEKTIEKTT
tara:strand:+ start:1182 stop:1415 length:234 start_codon:yes stop_codon:yes gene_type:complete